MTEAKIIIHGGIGESENVFSTKNAFDRALREIITKTYPILAKLGSREAVLFAVKLLEDNPIFNAGTGSKLQRDAQARMSASIISSDTNIFSGVINIKNVKNPVAVADLLSRSNYTVLSGDQATEFARRKKIPYYDPITEQRVKEYLKKINGDSGTVGAVAIDKKGIICSATSTGGLGFETAGRVSDSASVAGNYASKFAGVSCTGRGEKIINFSVASKIVTLVEAGQQLDLAIFNLVKKFKSTKSRIGLISIDHNRTICVGNGYNSNVLFAAKDKDNITTFSSKRNDIKQFQIIR